jgi:signal transduction histidine kinase
VKATRILFDLAEIGKGGLQLTVTDNGRGLAKGADEKRICEMGYTTTGGSGLGLYHVRQVLGEMGGTIEVADNPKGSGLSFLIRISAAKKEK